MSESELRQRGQATDPNEQTQTPEQKNASEPTSSLNLTPSLQNIERKLEKIAHKAWTAISYDALPEWLRDNEYLQGNHRPPMYSFRGCVKSLFRMHTETWNIWSHLIGAIFFVILVAGVYVFGDYITFLFEDIQIHNLPWNEQFMLMFFFAGAIACLMCSAMFHLFANHSKQMYAIFSRLDYSGIAFLITGSSLPAYYYGFYCTHIAKYIHILILIALCTACITLSMLPKFAGPKSRPLRFTVFVLFGLYGFIPGFHILFREGYAQGSKSYPFWGLLYMAAIYIFGGLLYVLRIPERFCPGRFDIWASSHQLFHLCVLAAALLHYDTLLGMIKYRLDVGSCIPMISLDMLELATV